MRPKHVCMHGCEASAPSNPLLFHTCTPHLNLPPSPPPPHLYPMVCSAFSAISRALSTSPSEIKKAMYLIGGR